MPSADRSAGRTLHIWDVNGPDDAIGGLRLVPETTITHSDFRDMLDIIIADDHPPYSVTHRESETQVARDSDAILARGHYDLASEDEQTELPISQTPVLTRAFSRSLSARDGSFMNAVRTRDLTSTIGHYPRHPEMLPDEYDGHEAAHIFPRAYESDFATAFESAPAYEAYRMSTRNLSPQSSGIDSVRNGLLLMNGIHQLWDSYKISVSPRSGYKVICFAPNSFNLEGLVLNETCRRPGDTSAVCDDLLQWHFRQAVLANMRGAGEPVFEHDFPPGSDMVGQILQAPAAAKRMQFELFDRLYGYHNSRDALCSPRVKVLKG